MSKENLCILCGKSIKEASKTDPSICVDCDKDTFKKRYFKNLL